MKKIESKLTDVPETMLIAIRARYNETKDKNGIINDPKSIEILDRIDHDFTGKKEVSVFSQKGVAVRTEILDELTNHFLSRHPDDAVVVNLGCGLDTRYVRMNNGKMIWFDLDVPQAIELRKNFFDETDKFKFISQSVLDFSWTNIIPKNKPTLFIAEGLLMYFTESEVKSILKTIGENFSNAEIVFEAMSPLMAKNSKHHLDVKKTSAKFKWGIKSGREIDSWDIGATFINEYFYNRHLNKMPLIMRAVYFLVPAVGKMMKIVHLRFTNNSPPLLLQKKETIDLLKPQYKQLYKRKETIPNFLNEDYIKGDNQKYMNMYNWMYPFYDFVEKVGGKLLYGNQVVTMRREMISRLEWEDNLSVLVVSIGTGRDLEFIPKQINIKSLSIVGADISQGMLKKCHKKFSKKLNLSLVQCCAEDLPFNDNSFDIVFSVGGFNFFNDKEKAVAEMMRVAKNGMKVLIADETNDLINKHYKHAGYTKKYFENASVDLHSIESLLPNTERKTEMLWNNKFYCITFRNIK